MELQDVLNKLDEFCKSEDIKIIIKSCSCCSQVHIEHNNECWDCNEGGFVGTVVDFIFGYDDDEETPI